MDDKFAERELLSWVNERMEKLNKMEAKLQEMKLLAEIARDSQTDREKILSIQKKMNELTQEVNKISASLEENYH